MKYGNANNKRDNAASEANEVLRNTGCRSVHSNLAKVGDIIIHRIKLHEINHPRREYFNGIEKRCGVRPSCYDYTPEVHNVAEKDGKCGKQQTKTKAKHKKINKQER